MDVRENAGIPAAFTGIFGLPTGNPTMPAPAFLKEFSTAGIFS